MSRATTPTAPRSSVTGTGLHETGLQRAVRADAIRVEPQKLGSCRTLRRSSVAHLVDSGYEVRTIQELVGPRDASTIMTCSQALGTG